MPSLGHNELNSNKNTHIFWKHIQLRGFFIHTHAFTLIVLHMAWCACLQAIVTCIRFLCGTALGYHACLPRHLIWVRPPFFRLLNSPSLFGCWTDCQCDVRRGLWLAGTTLVSKYRLGEPYLHCILGRFPRMNCWFMWAVGIPVIFQRSPTVLCSINSRQMACR